ncbi:2Fe-2S iron-sulfur cluster-binding protein [Cupriavidus basilensis]|uniref:2Fe-2S iron-sulfur cluster-binding protein n=1 Tax=Cupriavidus basilensis TaxID=68895 RepID=UPI0020A68949|nr:2Fe-2S iron-sulfur cluster-binding protein [Cupriavidus basilensis]MCP3020620.1 2Fe-2S iron-sulfur cluster-binding protein [Cupriavidus basilensis]MDR3383742.1 2Fe-2S iron-sulfur cluster-binding protein [Cupriavidus basilensis]
MSRDITAAPVAPAAFVARLEPQGSTFPALPTQTLLEAALQAGLKFPSSCRNGTCRTCLCRLAAGRIGYRIEWPGVSYDERDEGFILPCVAYPESDVVIEAPQSR